MNEHEAARIRRIAQFCYGEDCGHDNLCVIPRASLKQVSEEGQVTGYWVEARVWVPVAWVNAVKTVKI